MRLTGAMRPANFGPARVAAVLAALAAAGAATAATADARPQPKRLVVAPRSGQLIRSDVVRIAVRTGIDPRDLRARLNGVPIAADFGLVRRGVRTLQASASHGLRAGRNTLVVAVHPIGGRVRRSTVRFVVRTAAPMVGAGLDRRVVAGDAVVLRGRVRTRSGVPTESRWRVVSGPTCGGMASARLLNPTSPNARFRTRARGTYKLRLTAGRGHATASDSVTLEEVPRNPLVSVHTIAESNGKPGTTVGGAFFAAPDRPGNSSAFVHVLVLDRRSLGCMSNSTYVDLNQVHAALQKLDDEKADVLVIATVRDANRFRAADLTGALRPIGFPEFSFSGFSTNGSISVIGSTALNAGDADLNLDGGMDGYLTPDTNLEYRFISPQRLPFGYPKLPARCQPSSQNCDGIGFVVSDIDAHTGNRKVGQFFDTHPRSGDSGFATEQANKMTEFLNRIPRGDVVGIETDSNRVPGETNYPSPIGPVDRAAMDGLADAIANVGGTRNGFNRAGLTLGPENGAPVYSLVGWAGAGEGRGAEAAIGVDGAGESPYLNGVLRRDSLYEFRPAQTSRTGLVSNTIQNLVLDQPNASWPLSNDPGAMRALSWIGNEEPKLGPDPRAAFWTQSLTEQDTTTIANHINAHVNYPGPGHDFTEADFAKAKDELITELGWVGNVRQYMSDLSEPSTTKALVSWGEVQSIAQGVLEAARNPNGETLARWSEFTKIMLELLGPFTEHVTTELGALLDLGMWAAGAEADGSPGGEDVRVEAAKLGIALQRQALEAQQTYTRLGDMIVSDYAKLHKVGINGGCNPTSKSCDTAFSYDAEDRAAASAAAYRGIQRLAYEKLVPLGFNVYALNSDPSGLRDRSTPPDPAWYECYAYHPFFDIKPPASAALLQVVDPVHQVNSYDVFVLTKPPAASDEHAEPPPDDLLTRMFDGVPNSNRVQDGGLGIPPEELMRAAPHHIWKVSGAHCGFSQP